MPNLPVRDRSDAKIAGVCSALARNWGVDPLVVRVAFVIVGLMTNGFVLVVYALLWVLLPEPNGVAPLHRMFPATRAWSWGMLATITLLVAALAAAVSGTGPGAFVILALAWLILRFGFAGRSSRAATPQVPPPPVAPATPFERAAHAWQQRLDNVDAGRPVDWVPDQATEPDPAHLYGPSSPWDTPAPRPGTPVVRRRGLRTWLGILTSLGAVWAGLAVATAAGVVVPGLAWASATLVVLGLALLTTARPTRAVWGRPVLLLPVTILAAVGTLVLLVPGQVATRPLSAVGLTSTALDDATTRFPIGEHLVDLSDRVVADETVRYQVSIGDLTLVAPRAGNVVVRAGTGLGDVTMPDGTGEGFKVERTWERRTDPDGPTLTIEVSVGLGELVVRS